MTPGCRYDTPILPADAPRGAGAARRAATRAAASGGRGTRERLTRVGIALLLSMLPAWPCGCAFEVAALDQLAPDTGVSDGSFRDAADAPRDLAAGDGADRDGPALADAAADDARRADATPVDAPLADDALPRDARAPDDAAPLDARTTDATSPLADGPAATYDAACGGDGQTCCPGGTCQPGLQLLCQNGTCQANQ